MATLKKEEPCISQFLETKLDMQIAYSLGASQITPLHFFLPCYAPKKKKTQAISHLKQKITVAIATTDGTILQQTRQAVKYHLDVLHEAMMYISTRVSEEKKLATSSPHFPQKFHSFVDSLPLQ